MPERDLKPPGLRAVLAAQAVIRRFLQPTLLADYPALNALVGLPVYIKHENHQPVGAFKVRGGLYLMSQLSNEERANGVIAASTGNHGQSIAYAARRFDVPAMIGVPVGANPGKVEAMQAMGAEVIFHGHDYDECRV